MLYSKLNVKKISFTKIVLKEYVKIYTSKLQYSLLTAYTTKLK